MTTKLKNNSELVKILRDAGIVTKEYAYPNAVGTPAEFIISTIPGGRGILIKNSEAAKIEVAVCKKHRQAVLTVTEGKRKVVRNVRYTDPIGAAKRDMGNINALLRGRFPIVIPGAQLTVSDVEAKRVGNPSVKPDQWRYSGKVTATVNKTRKNTFLLGMDETSHFISVLPEKVNSVEQAHKLLKPKGLPKKVKRQGEFFFVPVKVTVDASRVRNSVQLEGGSNHYAQYGVPRRTKRGYTRSTHIGAFFVKGLIYDKRGYRHAPVDLGDVWHKVVRNKESMTAVPKGTRVARRYD